MFNSSLQLVVFHANSLPNANNPKGEQEEKLRKEAAKIEAKEKHKAEQELDRWEKGKSALQNMMALIDTKVVESGLIGGSSHSSLLSSPCWLVSVFQGVQSLFLDCEILIHVL
jgi:hypothetical protein